MGNWKSSAVHSTRLRDVSEFHLIPGYTFPQQSLQGVESSGHPTAPAADTYQNFDYKFYQRRSVGYRFGSSIQG